MTICTLTGPALKAEASRLAIPGRSRMTAAELRAAVDTVTAITDRSEMSAAEVREVIVTAIIPTLADTVAAISAQVGKRDIPAPPQRPTAPVVPFTMRRGKRKPSVSGRIHRRSI